VILAGEGTLGVEHFMAAPKPSSRTAPGSDLDISVGITIDEAEQSLIRATLTHAGNNKTRAAQILGISAKTLHVKLKQYSLDEEEVGAKAN
jgi:DNA-binding NtrC family response regulator